MRLIKKYIHPILLYVILTIFFIEIFLLLIQMCQGFYKYFLISELNLIKRYGKNSWVIITGASSGQGRDFAIEFAKRGFNILMIGSERSYDTEKEIKKITKDKVKTLVLVKDFRKAFEDDFFNDISVVFNQIGSDIGVLINNVGYRTAWKPYHQMPVELIKDTIAIGTMVQSRLTQIVIPYFLDRLNRFKLKSALVNITAQCLHPNFLFGLSLSNEISVPYLSVYEASNAFGFYQGNSIYKELTQFYSDDQLDIIKKKGIKLDDLFTEDTEFDLIKIDTQGSELDIINGGSKLCSKAKGILLEVSLTQYNENAPLYNDVIQFMNEFGFIKTEILDESKNHGSHQKDILFINTKTQINTKNP
jgi:short-subunit dehydrogenase